MATPGTRAAAVVAWGGCCVLAVAASADVVVHAVVSAPDTVLIHAGRFDMGSDVDDVQRAIELCRAYAPDAEQCSPQAFTDEQPRHEVRLRAYRIDRTEVTRRSYQRCVEQAACVPLPTGDLDGRLTKQEHPVIAVRAAEAERYCAWLGGRLPTEAEWERAARGNSHRAFPWGTRWNSRIANYAQRPTGTGPSDGYTHTAPVTAFADGRSAYGLLGMAGNVWELTADRYAEDSYGRPPFVDPRGAIEGHERVIRGGGFGSPPHALRVTERASLPEHEARPDVGFRCAYDAP